VADGGKRGTLFPKGKCHLEKRQPEERHEEKAQVAKMKKREVFTQREKKDSLAFMGKGGIFIKKPFGPQIGRGKKKKRKGGECKKKRPPYQLSGRGTSSEKKREKVWEGLWISVRLGKGRLSTKKGKTGSTGNKPCHEGKKKKGTA